MELTKESLRDKITTDDKWATRALLALYARQTADEQQGAHTNTHNAMGFNKFDAEFMTSLVAFYKQTGFLTPGQLAALKKKLGKYAGQLLKVAQQKS